MGRSVLADASNMRVIARAVRTSQLLVHRTRNAAKATHNAEFSLRACPRPNNPSSTVHSRNRTTYDRKYHTRAPSFSLYLLAGRTLSGRVVGELAH